MTQPAAAPDAPGASTGRTRSRRAIRTANALPLLWLGTAVVLAARLTEADRLRGLSLRLVVAACAFTGAAGMAAEACGRTGLVNDACRLAPLL
jgi:hypothetical protein